MNGYREIKAPKKAEYKCRIATYCIKHARDTNCRPPLPQALSTASVRFCTTRPVSGGDLDHLSTCSSMNDHEDRSNKTILIN